MKKLIPTICMLLIAACMFGTSTYAWFSMNKTVTATGMKVKATTASTLLIDLASATDLATGKLSAGANTKARTINPGASSAATLAPTSTLDGSAWFTATAALESDEAAVAGSYEVVSETDLDKYRLVSTFYLQVFDADSTKNDTAANLKLYVDSITITHTSNGDNAANYANELNNCLRVMVVVDDEVVCCAPMATGTRSNDVVSAVSGSSATISSAGYTSVSTIESNKKAILGDNTLVASMNYNKVYEANIYIFFEGEDADCFTNNIPATLNDYTVEVSFSTKDI